MAIFENMFHLDHNTDYILNHDHEDIEPLQLTIFDQMAFLKKASQESHCLFRWMAKQTEAEEVKHS